MKKKVFIYAFLVIFAVVFILTTFYYSLLVCNKFYTGDKNDTGDLVVEPQNMYVLPDGELLIFGSYDYGVKQNKGFYKIYDKNGNLITYATIGTEGRAIDITGVQLTDNGFVFTCIDKSLNDFRDVTAQLYFINSSYEVEKKVQLDMNSGEENEVYYNIVPVDGSRKRFACISDFYVYIFSDEGAFVTRFPLTNVAKVLCVSKIDETYVIGGSLAKDELLDSFKDAFIAGYDEQGTMLWQNVYCENENVISTIVSLKNTGNGNFIAYGRYIDYSKNIEEGESLTEMSIDDFYRLTYYGNHTDFQVITPDGVIDYTLQASVFLQSLDSKGKNIKQIEFNAFDDYAVPMPLNVLFNNETEFIPMMTYTLTSYKSQRYNINIDLYNSDLTVAEEIRLKPNQRTKIIFTMNSDKNIYTYHSLGGLSDNVVRRFENSAELNEKLQEIELMLAVRDGFSKVYEIIDWLFIAVLVFFSQSIKACRRIDK